MPGCATVMHWLVALLLAASSAAQNSGPFEDLGVRISSQGQLGLDDGRRHRLIQHRKRFEENNNPEHGDGRYMQLVFAKLDDASGESLQKDSISDSITQRRELKRKELASKDIVHMDKKSNTKKIIKKEERKKKNERKKRNIDHDPSISQRSRKKPDGGKETATENNTSQSDWIIAGDEKTKKQKKKVIWKEEEKNKKKKFENDKKKKKKKKKKKWTKSKGKHDAGREKPWKGVDKIHEPNDECTCIDVDHDKRKEPEEDNNKASSESSSFDVKVKLNKKNSEVENRIKRKKLGNGHRQLKKNISSKSEKGTKGSKITKGKKKSSKGGKIEKGTNEECRCNSTRSDLQMELFGIVKMKPSDIKLYGAQTAQYIEDFYNNRIHETYHFEVAIAHVQATVEVSDVAIPSSKIYKRNMIKKFSVEECEGDSLYATFTIFFSYITSDVDIDPEYIISLPFDTSVLREIYTNKYLKRRGRFSALTCTSAIFFPDTTSSPTPLPTMWSTSFLSLTPTPNPTAKPTEKSVSPNSPTVKPPQYPTNKPINVPTKVPTVKPTNLPSTPSRSPTNNPTSIRTGNPTKVPMRLPSTKPSIEPSPVSPSRSPTSKPMPSPANNPTNSPTRNPTNKPTIPPGSPSRSPTNKPTPNPTSDPTRPPTREPTNAPTVSPGSPSRSPTNKPTHGPTNDPTSDPTKGPIRVPTINPTNEPTFTPGSPSWTPTNKPTQRPSRDTTNEPTRSPTRSPTSSPTVPLGSPSRSPTNKPIPNPTNEPTIIPTIKPINEPTVSPGSPSRSPTNKPTAFPTKDPTNHPTKSPITKPTSEPTVPPGPQSRSPTAKPTSNPTRHPTNQPTRSPTWSQTSVPTVSPGYPSRSPSAIPSQEPSTNPTMVSYFDPSVVPSIEPTEEPSNKPTLPPGSLTESPTLSDGPSHNPTLHPMVATFIPSSYPSIDPTLTLEPTLSPEEKPSTKPSLTCDSENFVPRPRFSEAIVPDDSSAGEMFSFAVEVDKDVAILGAPGRGVSFVYEFFEGSWSHVSTLSGDDEEEGFGYSVAKSENIIVVGSPNSNDRTGKVYIFEIVGTTNNILSKDTLIGENREDQFGTAVDVSEAAVVVGSPFYNGAGAVYIYKPAEDAPDQWENWQKIIPDIDAGDFGFSVAVYFDTLVIGSPYRSKPSTESGVVFIYRREMGEDGLIWKPFQRLYPTNENPEGGNFGNAVDIYIDLDTIETTVVVGARNLNFAFVYTDPTRDKFELQQSFTASESIGFGFAVSVDQDNIAIGAPYGFGGMVSFWYRENDVWIGNGFETPEDVEDGDFFGSALSIDGNHLIVGAPLSSSRGAESGSAYEYEIVFICNDSTYKPTSAPSQYPSKYPSANPTTTLPTPQCNTIPASSFATSLLPGDVGPDSILGFSLDIDGNYAVLGAPNYQGFEEGGVGDGKAYIYEYSHRMWNLIHTFESVGNNGGTGYSVSIASFPTPVIAVGSPYEKNSTGSVYILEILGNGMVVERDNFQGDAEGDFFGNAVDVSENVVVVGSPFHEVRGAAYIYTPGDVDPNKWALQAKLNPPEGASDFGFSVAIFIDTIVVGSPYRTNPLSEGGSAFVYRRSINGEVIEWDLFQSLPAFSSGDQFGSSVDVFIDTETFESIIVVGARNADGNTGAAYTYTDPEFENFELQQILKTSESTTSNGFGYDVSLYEDFLVVGAPFGLTGSASFYYNNGGEWIGSTMSIPENVENEAFFGSAVAVHGDNILIGSSLSDTAGENSGIVHLYDVKKVCE